MPRLRVLSIADNGRLTAAAVAHLSTALPDLKWLDLSDTDLEPGWSGGDGGGGGSGGGGGGLGGLSSKDGGGGVAAAVADTAMGAGAGSVLSTLPPGLRTVRLLRCPWVTRSAIWRLEQARQHHV